MIETKTSSKKIGFGSSGIRGIANREVTPQLALQFGNAIGSNYPSALVARDTRVSAQMIEAAVVSGLLSAGCRVTTCGVVPTPTLALASKQYSCGIMITASHNPAEYVGMKAFFGGMAFNIERQNFIEHAMNSELIWAGWEKTGDITRCGNEVFITQHKKEIMRRVISSGLKVVVDCGCGAGSVITPYLLREMGCTVITLNSQPDGFFPGRDPEPNNETLDLLKKTVVSCEADVGIAHDGDADRMMAVDNKGNFVTGDKLLTLFALKEAKTSISIPLDSSQIINELLPKNVKVHYTKVGDVYISNSLIAYGGEFGGEQSGAFIFPEVSMCPDGIYSAARLIQIIDKSDMPFSDLLAETPQYETKRQSYPCRDVKETMRRLHEGLAQLGVVNEQDGIKISMDGGWILVRPSGTEPKIRLTVESKETDGKLFAKAEDIVQTAIRLAALKRPTGFV